MKLLVKLWEPLLEPGLPQSPDSLVLLRLCPYLGFLWVSLISKYALSPPIAGIEQFGLISYLPALY